jgi:hypothetical protein
MTSKKDLETYKHMMSSESETNEMKWKWNESEMKMVMTDYGLPAVRCRGTGYLVHEVGVYRDGSPQFVLIWRNPHMVFDGPGDL